MTGPHAVGIDVGTTNVKVALVAADGTLVSSAQRSLAHAVRTEGDLAELDADAQWRAVVEAVREAAADAQDAAAAVVAVGVDSQYSSIVPLAADCHPVAPMRLWSDRRGTARSVAVLEQGEAFMGFVERHGVPPVGGGLSLGHVLHLQHDCPDVHAATAAYVEPMDHVNARLTGRIASNQATQFTVQLVDNRALGRTAYDDVLLGWSGVDPTRLPPLLPLDEPVGPLLDDVAATLGLPRAAVVYAGINDTHAGAVATDAFAPGRAGLSIGTTSVLVDVIGGKQVDLEHQLVSCPSPFADTYLLMAENGLGGRSVEHVVDHVLGIGFARLDEVAAAAPAGSDGLLFLPWLRGAMAPASDGTMRGGFIGLGLEHGPAHLARASLEGVAHNLAWLLPHCEALTGEPVEEVTFVGGAARSSLWAQVLADVLGRPVRTAPRPDRAIARATALLALHRHGALTRAELAERCRAGDPVVPDAAAHEVHAAHQPHFEAAFEALRPISAALRS